ncbi:hypothetical protein SLA2020_399390 [Shorea laevis]
MEVTPQQLSQYNGTDPSKPIYVAVKGRIFDVTNGKSFYGPGGPYALFAGKDASRALAKMSKNDEDVSPLSTVSRRRRSGSSKTGRRSSKLSTQLLVASLLNL